MTVLFGAHGMAATLTSDAARGLLQQMGARAAWAAIPLPSIPVTTTAATDGVAFAVCERQHPGESLPSPMAQAPQLWLALQGRLDNRAELASLLHTPRQDEAAGLGGFNAQTSDAALVLAAYQRFGIDCVEHLLGDWVLALWDAGRQRLVLARDATGISALFWWRGNGELLFASSLPTLLAAKQVPARPDPRWLAGLLVVFSDPARLGATAFEDIQSIPPGHLLLAESGRTELRRWWRPEELEPLDDAPWPDMQAQFLSLYEDAVRQRLRRPGGTVAATLSAGLDSGSVVALAAPLLAREGQRLCAFVHTPRFDSANEHPGRTADEWQLAQTTARHVGNVDTVACPSVHLSPLDGIRKWLDVASTPSHAASNWYWLLDIAAAAAATGARVLLTGQGGNATVSYNGTGDLWPRLAQLRLARVWRELRSEEQGWAGGVRDRLVKPALRPAWHRLKRASSSLAHKPGWYGFGLLNLRLADELGLAAAMRAARHDPGLGGYAPDRLALYRLGFLGGADNGNAATAEWGQAHGLEIRDPTRDRRLVELCWRFPDELFWSHGRQRGLIRSAMHDRLPPAVLDSTRKGLQSADLRQRLRACSDDLSSTVDAVSSHPLVRQWIDTDRLSLSARAALSNAAAPTPEAVPATHLMRALAAAVFVARRA